MQYCIAKELLVLCLICELYCWTLMFLRILQLLEVLGNDGKKREYKAFFNRKRQAEMQRILAQETETVIIKYSFTSEEQTSTFDITGVVFIVQVS